MDSPGATSVEFALANHAAEALLPATKKMATNHSRFNSNIYKFHQLSIKTQFWLFSDYIMSPIKTE
jgi:hypothetical protein